jgi:glycosyltransferase involved in cell wall biosynthesis
MNHPRASVIVPTYNRALYLDRTLASWLGQTFADYELVVIDDGSSDETGEVLRRYEGRLPLRHQAFPNGGRAAARNRGLALARGAIIIFSDDDRIVEPGFVAAHVRSIEEAGNAVILGMQFGLLSEVRGGEGLSPAMVLRLAAASPAWRGALERGESFETVSVREIEENLKHVLSLLRVPDPWSDRVFDVVCSYGSDLSAFPLAWALGSTANMSVPADALREAGHFDESFRGWGLEDFELNYRLQRQGTTARFCTAAVNYHQNHPRNFSVLEAEHRSNAQRFMRKHRGLEPLLFFLHARHVVSLREAAQLGSDLAAMEGTLLFGVLHETLKKFSRGG